MNMKPSHEFRRHTYAARLDWRTDCGRLANAHMTHVGSVLLPVVRDIAVMRLNVALQPHFDTLDRICNLLKSLKYVVVLALLLCHINPSEARHVRHHHYKSDDSVRVYDPPRVEARPVASVFDTGYFALRYPLSNVLWETPEPTPEVVCPTIPQPTPVSIQTVDHTDMYAKMVLAAGVLVLLGVCGYRVTGRYDDPAWQYDRYYARQNKVTLVETRRYLPRWVSSAYLLVKHNVRLR